MKLKAMKHRRLPKAAAFTLLEIILATVLIVIGVVTVVRCMSTGVITDYSVEGKLTALNLARQEMEELKTTAYDSLSSSSDTPSGFSNYSRTWTITDNTYYKTVVVSVSWDFKGQTQSVSLTSYIVDRTPFS